MKYCSECGQKLPSGMQKFCPECGQKLAPIIQGAGAININNTSGDVIGTVFTGSGNIIGKDIKYTVQGNVYQLINPPREAIEALANIKAAKTELDATSETGEEHKVIDKAQEAMVINKQASQFLDEIKRVENTAGTEIKQIRVGDLQISKNELSIKEAILNGNEHYYKKEYNEAIECYDKAIECYEPNYVHTLYNKGNTLYTLAKYNEAIEWYNKAMEIDPNYAEAWYNKGNALAYLEKYDEAIECYDKALEVNSNDALAWDNKGVILQNYFEKYNEAIECHDKALQINPNYAEAWYNKGAALDDLGKYDEAIECYDKALQINPNHAEAQNNKGITIRKREERIEKAYAESRGSNKKVKWYTSDGKPVYE